MNRKWITFDLDGTLMQNPFTGYVFPELEEIIGQKAEREIAVFQTLVQEHEQRMKEQKYVDAYDWDDIVRSVLQREGITLEVDVEQLVIKHCVEPKVYLLEEGIADILQQLKEKGYSLAVVTNGFMKYQAPVLKALGIYHYFAEIITPEKVGYGKPDKHMLGMLERETIVAHVGDRIDHDIAFANQLDIPSILICRNLPPEIGALSPKERVSNEACVNLCLQKLKKLTGEEAEQLSPLDTPKLIIQSLDELLYCVSL